MYKVRCFESFDLLPQKHRDLIEKICQNEYFLDPAWFVYLMKHFYPGRHQLLIFAVEEGMSNEPLLLMPLRLCNFDYSAFGARTLGSISHPENYATVAMFFAAERRDQEDLLTYLLRHFKSDGAAVLGSRADVLRLWPVDLCSASGQMVVRALRRAGFYIQRYANSYNRYEDTSGLSYEEYFSQRSANLRYSVRRRQRALEKSGALELLLYRNIDNLNQAIDDYTSVSLGSWKDSESMVSRDLMHLIRLTAENGCMRLGILRFDGVPAAAQFWIVAGGVAHCSRLAYHEDFKQLAVGVVLTNFMVRHVLEDDHVRRIDFGYGQEDYKSGWMKDARDYHGLLAFNFSTQMGIRHGLRNIVGRPLKRAIKSVLSLLHLRRSDLSRMAGRQGAQRPER